MHKFADRNLPDYFNWTQLNIIHNTFVNFKLSWLFFRHSHTNSTKIVTRRIHIQSNKGIMRLNFSLVQFELLRRLFSFTPARLYNQRQIPHVLNANFKNISSFLFQHQFAQSTLKIDKVLLNMVLLVPGTIHGAELSEDPLEVVVHVIHI